MAFGSAPADDRDIFVAAAVLALPRLGRRDGSGYFIGVNAPIGRGLFEMLGLAIGKRGLRAAFLALGKTFADGSFRGLIGNDENAGIGRRRVHRQDKCQYRKCKNKLHREVYTKKWLKNFRAPNRQHASTDRSLSQPLGGRLHRNSIAQRGRSISNLDFDLNRVRSDEVFVGRVNQRSGRDLPGRAFVRRRNVRYDRQKLHNSIGRLFTNHRNSYRTRTCTAVGARVHEIDQYDGCTAFCFQFFRTLAPGGGWLPGRFSRSHYSRSRQFGELPFETFMRPGFAMRSDRSFPDTALPPASTRHRSALYSSRRDTH